MELETGVMCLQAEEHQDGQQPSLDGRETRGGFSSEPPERTRPAAAGLWTVDWATKKKKEEKEMATHSSTLAWEIP